MNKILSTGVLLIILFYSCSESKDELLDSTYHCSTLPYFSDTTERATSKTLKGHFLFSWKNIENGWNYAIVPNLNITAAHKNISAGNSFSGEECLQNNLSLFAEGEEIWWSALNTVETVEGKKLNLSYPPESTIIQLKEFCDQINIELIVEEIN